MIACLSRFLVATQRRPVAKPVTLSNAPEIRAPASRAARIPRIRRVQL